MNSKSLVFVVFAVWSVICWRWYVCGLMQACGDDAALPGEEIVAVPDERLDTTASIPPAINPKTKPVSPDNMNEVQMETVEDRMVIHFPYKSTRKEDNAAIDSYLASLAQHLISTNETVTIAGHADFVGSSATNYNFGIRRANGIRDILVQKGVSKGQIVCKSFGDRKPVATNDTPYGRYLNRRAEIRVGK